MSDKDQTPRLPPPAFPPGQRRYVPRSGTGSKGAVPAVRRMDSDEPIELLYDPIELAFISPDEPLPERRLTLAPDSVRRPALRLEGTDAGATGTDTLAAAAAGSVRERPPAITPSGIAEGENLFEDAGDGVGDPIGAAGIDDAAIEAEEEEEGEVVGMDLDTHLGSHRRRAEVLSKYDPYIVDLTDSVQRLADALARHGEVALQTGPKMSPLDQSLRLLCTGYLAGRRTEVRPLAVKFSDD